MADSKAESALIALGTSMAFGVLSGEGLLRCALHYLQQKGFPVRAVSSFWRSAAWPTGSDQPDYVNAVAELAIPPTTPQAILAALHEAEAHFGRERGLRWAARTLDLDLLTVGQHNIRPMHEGDLELPHPRLAERAFVLAPLLEICPRWTHPVTGETGSTLLAHCADRFTTRRLGDPNALDEA